MARENEEERQEKTSLGETAVSFEPQDDNLKSTLRNDEVSSARFDYEDGGNFEYSPAAMNRRRSSQIPHRRRSRRRSSAIHPTHQQLHQQLHQGRRESKLSFYLSSSMNFGDLQDASHFLDNDNTTTTKEKKHDGDDDGEGGVLDAKEIESSRQSCISWTQKIFGVMGMIVGLVMCFITIDNNREINQTMAIAIWMATLWVTEIIPLVVTAFLPLVLFPSFGILSSETVAIQYMNNTIWLLISGFFMALTLERWNLHRRFSMKILALCGTRPHWILAGMMGATFFLSMFVSNTATTLMMVPNALSICTALEKSSYSSQSKNKTGIGNSDISNNNDSSGEPSVPSDLETSNLAMKSKKFAVAMMLGIAYSANVGGMSSLIGTAPNLVFKRQLEMLFPDAPEMTFSQWLGFGLPVGLVFFLIIWIYLCLMYLRDFTKKDSQAVGPNFFKEKYQSLGPWNREQVVTTLAFCALCLLWLFRADLNFGSLTIKGWSSIFPEPSYISDATTGMMIAFLLFICPARSACLALTDDESEGEYDNISIGNEYDTIIGEEPLLSQEVCRTDTEDKSRISIDTTILDWDTANKIPYDVIFLLGGGFALAKGFVESGLSQYLGNNLAGIDITLPAMVLVLVTLIMWLTEVTSNTSTADIMILIAASLAVANQVSPYTYMIPATMSCSCAFVLPIATPPNMVVFSTGRLPMQEMNKAGVFLNIIGSLLLLGAAYSFIPVVLDVEADEYPDWAETNTLRKI